MQRDVSKEINFEEYERIKIYLSSKKFKESSLFFFKVTIYLDKSVQSEEVFKLDGKKNSRIGRPIEVHFIFERFQRIVVECLDRSEQRFAAIEFTLGELICSQFHSIEKNAEEKGVRFGVVKAMFEGILPSQNQETRDSYQRLFIDYLKGNLNLSAMICVDFTASNIASKKNQLHAISTNQMNEYQQAIAAVIKVVLDYDNDELVPMFGFGAVPLMKGFNPKETSHFFPLTGDWDNPAGKGIMEVFQIYSSCISKVKMSGPTLFSPLLEQTIKYTERTFEKDKYHYTILLILTDGIIHDMEETVELIVEAANLPISILIIGVGTEDFTCMHQLDADGQIMKNEEGHVAKRDIVQFVDYSKMKFRSMDDLVAEVLKEVPKQICTFYKMAGIDPRVVAVKRALGDDEEFEPVDRGYSYREIPDESIGGEGAGIRMMRSIPDFKADKLISGLNVAFKYKTSKF